MKFGKSLLERGIITDRQFMDAVAVHVRTAEFFGTIAVRLGYMKPIGVVELIEAQTADSPRCGEIAVRRGLLTDIQVDEILEVQASQRKTVGEILVKMNAITREEHDDYLESFRETVRS